MQVSNLVLIIAIEIYLALLVATIGLVYFALKQKKLIKRQQEKLKELLDVINNLQPFAPPEKGYVQHIEEQLTLTSHHFNRLAPKTPIDEMPSVDAPLSHQTTALRHAFLSAEALGTEAISDSETHWAILEQALTPLLQQPTLLQESNNDELEIHKKRIENLEKFKTLFFDLEDRWNQAQTHAQAYYNELYAIANDTPDPQHYHSLLGQYKDSYDDIKHHIYSTKNIIAGSPPENKTINIIRQDPRAAEEIIKLRNVAADQYRMISDLQRKLDKAMSSEEKDLLIRELDQQLQRQVRFVQESDTCMQLLEEELHKANEKLAAQGHQLAADQFLEQENMRIKETLQNFAHESKELLMNIEVLEKENDQLKHNHEEIVPDTKHSLKDAEALEMEITKLRKQYAELEEKYLDMKLK